MSARWIALVILLGAALGCSQGLEGRYLGESKGTITVATVPEQRSNLSGSNITLVVSGAGKGNVAIAFGDCKLKATGATDVKATVESGQKCKVRVPDGATEEVTVGQGLLERDGGNLTLRVNGTFTRANADGTTAPGTYELTYTGKR